MTDRALAIRACFDGFERRSYGREWSTEELALGLVGDIGDLAKLVQAWEGVRAIDDVSAKLEHELADILWSVIVIADKCKVDLHIELRSHNGRDRNEPCSTPERAVVGQRQGRVPCASVPGMSLEGDRLEGSDCRPGRKADGGKLVLSSSPSIVGGREHSNERSGRPVRRGAHPALP